MRIFLSYAAEQRTVADGVALRLRQAGHEVFFDRDALPPAESFDERIRKAVENSDLLVFLISPDSVAPGAYSLTEMNYARARWKDPSRRVLPVMVVPTPYEEIPEYLKAVTVLEPRGNAEAETVAAVAEFKQSSRRLIAVLAAIGVVVLLGMAGYWWYQSPELRPEYRRTYFASFDAVAAGEEEVWLLGSRGDWKGDIVDGSYRLCNTSGNASASFSNRLSYLDGADQPINQSETKASLKVKLEAPLGQNSGAGLLYRKSPNRPGFYVFMLTGGGAVSVALVERSLRVLWSDEVTDLGKPSFTKLSVVGIGERLEFYVEDQLVHTTKDDGVLSGDPGVFAISTGCFVFDDVAVYLPASGLERSP